MPDQSFYIRAERRIANLTLLLGVVAGLLVAWRATWRWGAGISIGAVLAWLSFRWLKRGLDSMVAAATQQAGSEKVEVPITSYFLAAFRYGLIALTIYVIFSYLNVPVLSMIVGLCALGAATFAVSVLEILHPPD